MQFAAIAQPLPKVFVENQLAERGFANLDLVVAGPPDLAAQADDARAGVARRAQRGVRVTAHLQHVPDVAERLDVVDDGRAHVQAKHGREVRRLDTRVRPLALERLDEAGFLAANVRARAAVHVDLKIVAGAANAPAEEALGPGLVDGSVEDSCALGKFAANVNVGQLHVVGVARQDHALDELVRILVDDLSVLERARLGFVGVTDEINRLAGLAVDEIPLHAAREASAAAAPQPRDQHLLADVRLGRHHAAPGFPRLEPENLFQGLVAAVFQVTLDVYRVTRLIDVLQNQFVFFRHLAIRALTNPARFQYVFPRDVAEWCNGSTTVSDTVCLGSNPSSATIFIRRISPGFHPRRHS